MYRVKLKISLVLLATFFYGLSILLLTHYKLGDQVQYSLFYEALSNASAEDVMQIAKQYVSSVESISAYTLWVGAKLGIEKNIFISALNVVLLLGIFLLMLKHRVYWYFQVLIFTNYYLFVLLTGAERLKIAYIMIVYAAIIQGKRGYALLLASIFAHLQSMILLVGLAISMVKRSIKKKALIYFTFLIPCLFFVYVYLQEAVIEKATIYVSQSGGLYELFQVFLLVGLGVIVSRDKFRIVIALITMAIAVFFLGGARVNMIAFTLFIYLIMIERRLYHPLIFILLICLSLKSVFFVRNIFTNGSGFEGWLL